MSRMVAIAGFLTLTAVVTACTDESPPETPVPATLTATVEALGEPDGDLKATEAANQAPTPTPIPASPDCPAGNNTEAACDTALYLARRLRNGGDDFLVNAHERVTVTCGRTSPVSTERICAEVPMGETRAGLIYGSKVYVVLSEEEYRQAPGVSGWDDVELVGLGCPQGTDGRLDCSEWFMVGLDPVPIDPIESIRYTALLIRWNDGDPVVRANFRGMYNGVSPAFGGQQTYPLLPSEGTPAELVTVWWQPWRPE